MTRALTWASFVWDQALVRYVRLLHTKLLSRRIMWLSLAVSLAVTVAFGQTAGVLAQAAEESSTGSRVAFGVTLAACVATGPACIMTVLTLMIISAFLLIIVNMLFGVAELLTWILVKAASYNNFVNATAVTLGWTLVRDMVNMFFIIVLLIIAFSTIIGYPEFHYKKHLPKLLLMAVLINFSRTLVGVLIDFSQVITLTFVNGFKDAAFGNFAKAFGMSGLLKAAGNASGLGDVGSILIAVLFAVMILTIACTTLTILLLYFVIRIIMLWVLLILSPIAFFATALPAKMQKALSQVSSDWWSKLSSWLTGGPIVAFFLWLSLAVVQQGTNEFSKMAGPTSESEKSVFGATLTEVGNPDNIGLMIVSVALMLIGVQTAVSVSQQASPFLGGAAAKIKATGGPVTWAARKTGRLAARSAGTAIQTGATILAKKQIGYAGSIGKVPIVGGALAKMNLGIAGKAAGVAQGVRKTAQGEIQKATGNIPAGQRLAAFAALKGSNLNKADRAAVDREEAMYLTKGAGQKEVSAAEEARVRAANPGMSEDQIKAQAGDRAKQYIQKQLADAKKTSKENGDDETEKLIDEAYKKNPSLIKGAKDVKDMVNGIDVKDMVAGAMQDELVAAAVLLKHNVANDDGLVGSEKDVLESEPIKKILEQGGDKATFLRAAVRDFSSGEGKARLGGLVTAMNAGTDPGDKRLQMSKSADGSQILFASSSGTGGRAPMDAKQFSGGARRVASVEELVHELPEGARGPAQTALASLGASHSAFNGPLNNTQAQQVGNLARVYGAGAAGAGDIGAAQFDALANGIPASVATNYNTASNSYGSVASRQSHAGVLAQSVANSDNADLVVRNNSINAVANTDLDLIKKDGEMRNTFVQAMNQEAGKIKGMVAKAGDEQAKKLGAIFKELNSQAEKALNRGGEFSAAEKELIALREKLGGSKAMRGLGGNGEGKRKKK